MNELLFIVVYENYGFSWKCGGEDNVLHDFIRNFIFLKCKFLIYF